MPDNSSFGCMQSCSSKFELRLQLDSHSIAAISQAITGGMAEVARSVNQALEKLKRSMHDLGHWQRESLERSNELHFLLTRSMQYELDRLRRPPQQPSRPPPPELLQQQHQQQQQEPNPPTAPMAPTVPKPKGSKSLVPKQTATPKVPKVQASSRPPLQKPMPPQGKTTDFHLHHVLVAACTDCDALSVLQA